MNFGPRHYVPVLKVKRAEKRALSLLSSKARPHVVPLLEIVERTVKPTVERHLDTAFKDLSGSLYGYSRCLLDLREIAPDGSQAACNAFIRAANAGIPFTPVTGMSRTADVALAVAMSRTRGIGLRLTRQEFEDGGLSVRLSNFLVRNGLTPDRVDLIIDLGAVEDLVTAGVIAFTKAFLAEVPHKSRWRTLTVIGCAFPRSMGVVDRNSSTRIKRSEWLAWRDGLYGRRALLERLPTYGDCVIQHPGGVEGFNPRFMQASATIRYVSADDWLLVKGEGTKNNPSRFQFPQLATQLAYGALQSDFVGPAHCAGCKAAKDSADGKDGYGSPEVWRRIGTVHHITAVVQDLASLQ